MSDALTPFERIGQFYNRRVEQYGHDPRACDYGHPESQLKKFAILADVLPLANKTLLDVGCGFADYAPYVNARFGSVSYTGIDLSPQMIATAKQLQPGSWAHRLDDPPNLPGLLAMPRAVQLQPTAARVVREPEAPSDSQEQDLV